MAEVLTKDAPAPATIEVKPVTIHIGAEIGGVDLTRPLAPDVVREIEAAFLQWKVLFFHGQHLDHQQHINFARNFGELTVGHAVFGHVDGYPEVYSVAKRRTANKFHSAAPAKPWTGWHADITSAINPPAVSILRGVTIPDQGGDTHWTNLAAAYNGLSPTLRGFLDGLRGIHMSAPPPADADAKEHEDFKRRNTLVSEHPLVRVHPETGERVLYVSPTYIKSIVGLTPRESGQLLDLLREHAVRPEYTVRFRWAAGDIAMWDNRCVVHLAPTDIFEVDVDRQLYRVTLVGDVPVGVDGSPSRSIEGDPILPV